MRPISMFPHMTRVHLISLPPFTLQTALPWCLTLEMDPGEKKQVQMLDSPVVLSYAELVFAVV